MSGELDEKDFEFKGTTYHVGSMERHTHFGSRRKISRVAASPSPSEMEATIRRLRDYRPPSADPDFGREHHPICDEAADLLSQAQSALAAMRAQRDEAMDSAHNWHGQCEAIATILELHEPECLGFAGEVRSKFETLSAQVLRLTEENKALRKDAEPELSCPHLDAFISATNPPAEVIEEIETARNINSQLRYGLWHEKARAEAAEARIKALEEALTHLATCNLSNPHDFRQFARTALKENAL